VRRSSIWPGPECLESASTRHTRRVLALAEAGLPMEAAINASRGYAYDQLAIAAARARGIVEAHAKARARMKRFIAWLAEQDIAHEVAARDTATARSPEHAVRLAASRGMVWPFAAVGGVWLARLKHEVVTALHLEELADRLVGLGAFVDDGPSLTWAGLPWQQSPTKCPDCKAVAGAPMGEVFDKCSACGCVWFAERGFARAAT
jgi:hypothetical protein